jgi:hypothetical protein
MISASSTISSAAIRGGGATAGRAVLFLALLVLALVVATTGARAVAEQGSSAPTRNRLAIVIGNSDYASTRIEDLTNAKNDAVKIADSLTRLKFDVLLGTNLTADGFEKLFKEAEKKLPTASAVLIFYSGHGVAVQGLNYLLPTDTPDPDSLDVVISRAVKLNDLITRFSNRDRQTFIFLDACRNSPVSNSVGGLAQIEVGENAYVAFATNPNTIAVDGVGDNSPFTAALLDNIEIPGLSISDMMIRVRNETEKATLGRQLPWDQSNLREQFYFTEQQELDPVALSASLSRILSDPAAKQKLQVELASNDLQTAVLLVGQNLKSLEITAPEGGTGQQPQGGGTQVASVSGTESLQGAKQSVVSGIETLIGSPNEGEKDKATELARNIQTELRRVGCYRQTVDGDWGSGSVRALADYYRNTKQQVASTEPTVDLLSELFLRSGRICKQPVIVKKVASTASGDSGSSAGGMTGGGKVGGGKKGGGKKGGGTRPAAPPPDISGGIGIGGVF